jgi:transposase
MGKSVKYSQEVRERAVRMLRDHEHEYPTRWAAAESISGKIGRTAQTLVNWIRKTEPVSIAAASGQARVKQLDARTPSCAVRTRSCAKHQRILPRRSSTAAGSDDGVHRLPSRSVWGRADLRAAADCPIDVLRTQGPPSGCVQAAGSCAARC